MRKVILLSPGFLDEKPEKEDVHYFLVSASINYREFVALLADCEEIESIIDCDHFMSDCIIAKNSDLAEILKKINISAREIPAPSLKHQPEDSIEKVFETNPMVLKSMVETLAEPYIAPAKIKVNYPKCKNISKREISSYNKQMRRTFKKCNKRPFRS